MEEKKPTKPGYSPDGMLYECTGNRWNDRVIETQPDPEFPNRARRFKRALLLREGAPKVIHHTSTLFTGSPTDPTQDVPASSKDTG